jgi:hypothetical protein
MRLHELIVVLLSTGVVLLIVLGVNHMRAQRSKRLRAMFESLGGSFDKCPPRSAVDQFKPFRLYSLGFDQWVTNMCQARVEDFDICVCDFGFTVARISSKGANTAQRTRTPILLTSRRTHFPQFEVLPKLAEKGQQAGWWSTETDLGAAVLYIANTSDHRAFSDDVVILLRRFAMLNVEAREDRILFCEESDIPMGVDDVKVLMETAVTVARLLVAGRSV